MRVLLTSNASYDPPRGGSTRSNLIWLSHLARAGMIAGSCVRGPDARTVDPSGIEIVSVDQTQPPNIRSFRTHPRISARLGAGFVGGFEPRAATGGASHGRRAGLVYLAHTPQWYPFGPGKLAY